MQGLEERRSLLLKKSLVSGPRRLLPLSLQVQGQRYTTAEDTSDEDAPSKALESRKSVRRYH
jgi:hypothetical protein